ncbi:MAG: hypothetical protein JXD18_02950, partial [Anaerolineae bacterium]|nr:hypothetical protein [Anaerolineae bacterium]
LFSEQNFCLGHDLCPSTVMPAKAGIQGGFWMPAPRFRRDMLRGHDDLGGGEPDFMPPLPRKKAVACFASKARASGVRGNGKNQPRIHTN